MPRMGETVDEGTVNAWFKQVGDADLGQHAGGGGGYLGVHLVGADLEQRLALGDLVAHLLEPLVHGALVDRLAHPGHDHLGHQFLQA